MHSIGLLAASIFLIISLGMPSFNAIEKSSVEKNCSIVENEVEWLSYDEAVARCQKEPRKILVDVYTDWCGWCKIMDKTTFGHEEIAKYINKKYYAVKLNAEMQESIHVNDKEYKFVNSGKRGYHELAIALTKGNLSFPTVVVLSEEQKIAKILPGFQKPKDMDKILRYYGENHHKSTPYNLFAKTYRSKVK